MCNDYFKHFMAKIFFKDLFKLTSEPSNLIESYRVPWNKWNHQDHVTGIDADVIVYPELLRNIRLGREFNN